MTSNPTASPSAPVGLVLSGGGARAAYQVGVLKAIADVLPDRCGSPFPIICGTSAGGLNAAGLAIRAGCLSDGVKLLESVWLNLRTHQVYRTDWPGVLLCALKFLTTLAFGPSRHARSVSLLNNAPLHDLLTHYLDLGLVQNSIDAQSLRALCLTASGYCSNASVSFFQGAPDITAWERSRRIGVRTDITVEHLMASAAIPIFFPPVRVNREYFGDGALRQIAPLSPALHLGAEKVLVIGVGSHEVDGTKTQNKLGPPSIAQVVSHIMNSSFIDGMEADIERLSRINRTISFIAEDVRKKEITLRQVDIMVISPPAEKLDSLAMLHAAKLPRSIRLFVRGSGATQKSGAGLLSYLLFEGDYCRDLVDMGYQDTMTRREELLDFLGIGPVREATSNGGEI